MAIFIIGFMKGEVWGWNNIIILLCLALGVYLLYIFFFLERHTARPLWAPSTFANTKLLASSIGNFGFWYPSDEQDTLKKIEK